MIKLRCDTPRRRYILYHGARAKRNYHWGKKRTREEAYKLATTAFQVEALIKYGKQPQFCSMCDFFGKIIEVKNNTCTYKNI